MNNQVTVFDNTESGKLVKSFAWKNRAKSVLDAGYEIARQRFTTLETETQQRIQMTSNIKEF
jgi:cell fate (sporulation/competence/biofilm development) regulator YlbF (YheA/YmcA/DUF963 family)